MLPTVDSIAAHLAVHIGIGAGVRSVIIAATLRSIAGVWVPWSEVVTAAMSPTLMRSLLAEGALLIWGSYPSVAQIAAALAVVMLQIVTIRLLTDHERATVTIGHVLLTALLAQLGAQLISSPVARLILEES